MNSKEKIIRKIKKCDAMVMVKKFFFSVILSLSKLKQSKIQRCTDADSKISLYVRVDKGTTPRKLCILNSKNSRVIYQ